MTHSTRPAPAGLFLPDAILDALGSGLVQLEPVYAAHDPATLVSLRYAGFNAAAQRLLDLPAQPTGVFAASEGQEKALFAFCHDTFWTGEASAFAPDYVAVDGSRWRIVAQRSGSQLVMSFTSALPALQAAELAAHAATNLTNDALVGVSVFAADVTEQVHARQQREAGLAQLRTIFEQAPVGLVLLHGPDFVVEIANPAVCTMWGRARPEVLGQPLFTVLPEVVEQGIPELLAEVHRRGKPFVAEERAVQLRRHGQLETVYFQFVYQPLTDALGQVTVVVVVASDVSALVSNRQQLSLVNEELRTANAYLTRANVDLDNFIYTASHDLKAPITNIESLLLLLRKQLPAEAQQAGLVPQVLGMMRESVERFRLTIAQLTDLTRLQQVYAEPAQGVDLAAVIKAVRLDLDPFFEATGAQLMVTSSVEETVLVAPQHLRSIFYNLLSNAVKYRHPDRVPQVQLRCRQDAHQLVLEVQDNGLGLNEVQQAKLFGLFQRLHAHVEGSGVGLYMVKRIVENAGGTITLRSELGMGSTFTVCLPA